MAFVLVQNALQVNFESILSLPSGRMLKVFQALDSSGLRGFLRCSAVIYEEDMQEFFANYKIESDTVVSTVGVRRDEIGNFRVRGASQELVQEESNKTRDNSGERCSLCQGIYHCSCCSGGHTNLYDTSCEHLRKEQAAPKRKLIVEEDSDFEDAEPLKKMIKDSAKPTPVSTSASKTLVVEKPIKTTAESSQHSDDESLSLKD
ncbi:pentatricopeptide repeat-containing protein [Dorcoceras hygrometricum]|uniref:Pentatricopeptide repeat-containing protein n=1 Tax=Dorcoceras hygrometricum TaxID=472368 RepID=A0A2Z7A4A3_9LAMI|nr:pentatricopeptide repeat-containing protein [Dorcoceras hygrometricum]